SKYFSGRVIPSYPTGIILVTTLDQSSFASILVEFLPYLIVIPLSFPILLFTPITQLSLYKCPPHFSITVAIASSRLCLTILVELIVVISDIVVKGVPTSQALF